jgi:6-pyruvoyl tetrahydropterin synthase/QueD family protein
MSFKILVEGGSLGFSAAHFITFEGRCEPLHGHNYGVRVEAFGPLSPDSYVVDFLVMKDIVRTICKDWDHRFLLPLHNPHLRVTERDDVWELEYDARNRYALAKGAVVPLDVDNATAERLAELLAHRIARTLRDRSLGATLERLLVGIEETEMQTAFYTLELHANASPSPPPSPPASSPPPPGAARARRRPPS